MPTDGFTFDDAELRRFTTDLGQATPRLAQEVRPVMRKAAYAIKAQLQEEAKFHRSAPWFWQTITFDSVATDGGFEVEIGPDNDLAVGPVTKRSTTRRSGNLGAILYFGTAVSGPVLPDPQGALDAELPALEAYLAEAMVRSFPA